MANRTKENEAIARANKGKLDLRTGDRLRDEAGDTCYFVSYGDNEPIYLNLRYPGIDQLQRLPNSGFKRF